MKKNPITKKIVTKADVACAILREFRKSNTAKPTFAEGGKSRAKYFSIEQIIEWYKSTYNASLDRGWFGRSLHAAMSKNMPVKHMTITVNGKKTSFYNNPR